MNIIVLRIFILNCLNRLYKFLASLSFLKLQAIWIVFFMSIVSIIELCNIYLISKLVGSEDLLGPIEVKGISFSNSNFLIFLFSIIAFKFFFSFIFNKMLYHFSTSLENDLRTELFNDLFKIKYNELRKFSAADLSYTVSELTKNYTNGYIVPLFRFVNEILLIGLMSFYLITVNAFIFLSIFLFVASFIVFSKFLIINKDEALGEQNILYSKNIINIVNVLKNGYKEIFANDKFLFFKLRLSYYSSLLQKNQLRYFMKSTMPKIYLEFLSVLLIIICIHLFHFVQISNPLFVLTSIVLVSLRLAPSISSLNSLLIQLKYNYPSWERIAYLKKNYRNTSETIVTSYNSIYSGTIFMSNINFYYGDKVIFNDAELRLDFGKCYVLSGRSGIGKSTLFDLISGILDSDIRFMINGKNSLNISHLVSYLPQEPFIFNGSILENLIYSNEYPNDIVKKDVEHLLHFLELDSFISQFDNDIYSEVSLNDTRISGGQKQRIGFARVILMGKPILLLDEFTSALDYEMTNKMLDYLLEYSINRIILIISHDLEVINKYNNTLYIDKNKINSISN